MIVYHNNKPGTRRHPNPSPIEATGHKVGKNAWKTDTDQGGPPIQCVFTDLVSPPAFVEIDAYRTLTAAKKAENLRLFGKGTPGWKLHVLPKIREARILRSLHDYISPGSPSVIAASGGWEAAGC